MSIGGRNRIGWRTKSETMANRMIIELQRDDTRRTMDDHVYCYSYGGGLTSWRGSRVRIHFVVDKPWFLLLIYLFHL